MQTAAGTQDVAHGHAPMARAALLQNERLARIRAYVEANLDNREVSPRGCARSVGLSVRLLHLTLKPTGETFGQLLQRRRLQACCALLAHPNPRGTVADVAFACGFNSLSSFYRAFRRAFGICPGVISNRGPLGKEAVLF